MKNGKIAYVAKKVLPPARPLSSTFVRIGIRARHEGKPIPKAKPQKTSSIATSYSPNVGKATGNNDEITPKRTQKRRKRILLTLPAIIDPISADTTTDK